MRTSPRHLELLVLAALDGSPAHGYALRATLRARSAGVFDPAAGTLYPLLRRLELRGLLTASWQAGPRRERRVYRLTAEGSRELARGLRSWAEFVTAMTAVIGG